MIHLERFLWFLLFNSKAHRQSLFLLVTASPLFSYLANLNLVLKILFRSYLSSFGSQIIIHYSHIIVIVRLYMIHTLSRPHPKGVLSTQRRMIPPSCVCFIRFPPSGVFPQLVITEEISQDASPFWNQEYAKVSDLRTARDAARIRGFVGCSYSSAKLSYLLVDLPYLKRTDEL